MFFRSLATRGARELPERIEAIIGACQAAGYDLVILETPGIGQGDAAVVPLADVALYVMTPEFGAASQLEKIDMLDFADVVAINKFERRGAADALRDVSRQLIRNRSAFGARPQDMPVFGTSAATFNDNGVTALYQHLAGLLAARGLPLAKGVLPAASGPTSTDAASESLSGTAIPRVALPRYADHGDLLRFLREENLPGSFSFTAGCSRSSGRARTRPGC
ncbi:MAG: hypothetical protein ACRDOE_27460 [Streptosporangiaceae bacterium]